MALATCDLDWDALQSIVRREVRRSMPPREADELADEVMLHLVQAHRRGEDIRCWTSFARTVSRRHVARWHRWRARHQVGPLSEPETLCSTWHMPDFDARPDKEVDLAERIRSLRGWRQQDLCWQLLAGLDLEEYAAKNSMTDSEAHRLLEKTVRNLAKTDANFHARVLTSCS